MSVGSDIDPDTPGGSGSSGAGSLEMGPELGAPPEKALPEPEPEPEDMIAEDDAPDVGEAQHLETLCRAATLDLANPDTLPDF